MTSRVRSSMTSFTKTGYMHKRAMTDEVTPNFEKKVSDGVLVCNGAQSVKLTYAAKERTGFICAYTRFGTSYTNVYNDKPNWARPLYTSDWTGTGGLFLPSTLRAYMNGKRQAYASSSEIAAAHTEISAALSEGIASLLVTLAERDKTKNTVLRALSYLRRPLRDAMREFGRLSPRQRVDKLNNAWLEGRYGWRPFIYDTMSLVEASTATATDRLTRKSSITSWETSETMLAGEGALYGLSDRTDLIVNTTGRVRIGQTADFRAGVLPFMRKLGIYDLAGTAWDLIPYSFVADWFCNLGDMARAMQAYALIDERVGWTVYEETLKAQLAHYVIQPGPVPYNGGTSVMSEIFRPSGVANIDYVGWQRYKVDSFIPSFGLRNRLDWLKVVDSAALLRNIWTRFRR